MTKGEYKEETLKAMEKGEKLHESLAAMILWKN